MKGSPGKTIKTGIGNESGAPVINAALCSSCGLCARVCKSFTIIERDGMPTIEIDNGLGCIGCGQCMMVCPKGAITVTGRKISPELTFILPKKDKRAAPEALEGLLLSRRSVREYSARDVARKTIDRLLEISSSAPMGIPPSDVGVTVVHGRDRVQECAGDIINIFKKWRKFFNPVMMVLLRPFMKKTDIETMRDFILPAVGYIIDERTRKNDLLFYGAPCVLLFHQSPYADPVDGHIACTYAMIAAESLGLGTCMIGTVSFALDRENKLKEKWGIPSENKMAIAMIVGYPAFRYTRGIRRSFASVIYK